MALYGTSCILSLLFFFFFNDTATTEIYTLSLHDALPISRIGQPDRQRLLPAATGGAGRSCVADRACTRDEDRKSTRLNSSHANISYAVFCLKKKKKQQKHQSAKPPHPQRGTHTRQPPTPL